MTQASFPRFLSESTFRALTAVPRRRISACTASIEEMFPPCQNTYNPHKYATYLVFLQSAYPYFSLSTPNFYIASAFHFLSFYKRHLYFYSFITVKNQFVYNTIIA